jgi:hypothetical protein
MSVNPLHPPGAGRNQERARGLVDFDRHRAGLIRRHPLGLLGIELLHAVHNRLRVARRGRNADYAILLRPWLLLVELPDHLLDDRKLARQGPHHQCAQFIHGLELGLGVRGSIIRSKQGLDDPGSLGPITLGRDLLSVKFAIPVDVAGLFRSLEQVCETSRSPRARR